MKAKILSSAIAISILFLLPAFAAAPVSAAVTTGLYGAYWKGSFFGSPLPAWPGCQAEDTPPAGVPSSTPPTVTETDPNINFGSTTGFYWDESYSPSAGPPTAGPPGYPGGFAVTSGGYGVASASWGDKNLYTDYPTSTYFVDTEFSVEWTGYIWLAAGTTYYFGLNSDDASWLYINTTPGSSTISGANLIVSDAGEHGPGSIVTSSGVTVPTSGWYAIEVDYYETCDTQSGIDLSWATTAGGTQTIIPTTAFTPAAIGSNGPLVSPVPQFGFAAPLVAAIGLLAVVFTRRKSFLRTSTTV